MSAVAKPLSLEEEQEYRRDSGHGFDHYCSVTNFGVRRLLATIEEQRGRAAVLEEALREIAADELLIPVFRCQERSSGATCNKPALWVCVCEGLLGVTVACDECSEFYAERRPLSGSPSAMVGNLRDMARAALESKEADHE